MKLQAVLTLTLSALLGVGNACAQALPRMIPGSSLITPEVPELTNLWAQIVWAPSTNGLQLGVLLAGTTANLLLRTDDRTNAQRCYAPPGLQRFQAELCNSSGAVVARRAPNPVSQGAVYTNLWQIPKTRHGAPTGFLSVPSRGAVCYANLDLLEMFPHQAPGAYNLRIRGRVMTSIPKSPGDLATVEFPWISLPVHLGKQEVKEAPH
jgi:hypothetical protein